MSHEARRPVVLFVDDSRNNRLLMGIALSEQYTVLEAESGEEALALLAREPVAVLVTDLRMPGMNGLELAEAVRQRAPAVLRLLFTASTATPELLAAERSGLVLELLGKPLTADHVAERIAAALAAAGWGRTPTPPPGHG